MVSKRKLQINNQRLKNRRKRQRIELLDQQLEDKLYQEARLDPQTVEGQIKLDINRISPPPQLSQTDNFQSYYNYLYQFLPF